MSVICEATGTPEDPDNRAACGRPVSDGYICHEHTAQWERNLMLAAGVVPALAQLAALGRGGGMPEFTVNRGWVAENKPLPINESAMTALGHHHDTGVDLCTALVAGFRPPPREQRKIVGLLGYAAHHVRMLRLMPDAAKLYDDVRDLLEESAKVLNRRPEKRQSQAATDERNQQAFDEVMTLTDALSWLRIYRGEVIGKSTVRDWIKKKKLPDRRDDRGRLKVIPSSLLTLANGGDLEEVDDETTAA